MFIMNIFPSSSVRKTSEKKESKDQNDACLMTSGLFMELAREDRLLILLSLKKKPSKLSTLARDTFSTAQEVSRNLDRLIGEGLVRKEADGLFYVTEYGTMVLLQAPYFTFISKHKQFFESHGLIKSGVPKKYLQRIGQLEKCRTVNSATAVIQTLKKMESSACQSIKIMATQTWPEEGQILIDKAEQGVKVHSLLGLNTIFPRNVINEILPLAEKLIREQKLEPRVLGNVCIGICIADGKQAGIMFPDNNGEVDVNTIFVGDNWIFCDWCSDVFEYFWQQAKPDINSDKLKIVDF